MSAASCDRKKGGGDFCSAINCTNARRKESCRGKPFFRFPADEERCRVWVQNSRRADLLGKKAQDLCKVFHLCSDHFEEHQFTTSEKKRLIWNAVPTIFDVPNPPKPLTRKRAAPKDRSQFAPPSKKEKRCAATSAANNTKPVEHVKSSGSVDRKDPDNESPQIALLRRKLANTRNQLYREKKKARNLQEKLARRDKAVGQSESTKLKELKIKLSDFFSGATLQFLSTQLHLVLQKRQGRRWRPSDKAFALSLFHASPKAYRILKQLFLLPSVSTLRRTMRKIGIYPGFNRPILKALETKISSMPAHSKLCCVIFDEMALKEIVEYNAKKDYVEGLEDFGSNGRTKYVANHATVFMARGLVFPWKQTVGYALSSGPIKYSDLHSLLIECIENLEDIGLNVKAVIADQGSNNRKMLEGCCKISEEKP